MEAEKHGIPVLQPLRIREKDEYEKVLALEPDLIVTARSVKLYQMKF